MAASKPTDLQIHKGKTFYVLSRWEADPIIYKPITAITRNAPARITAPAHGLPNGWRVAIVSVKGMTEINASTPPKLKDFRPATVVDVDTLELNSVNSAEFKAYVSGGYVQFKTPVDLTGMTARLDIKDKIGGNILASTHPYTIKDENDQDVIISPVIFVDIDVAEFTISLNISAADTADIVWKKGVYELEILSGSTVTLLLHGGVTVREEVPL